MNARFAAVSLLLGNMVTAVAILGPAGMVSELAAGLSVTIRDAGLLMTFGAVLLCFMSPVIVWATSTLDRRSLLVAALAVLAAGHIASALAPNYATLLALRLVMLTLAAAYTPVAASTIAQMVAERQRPSAISFVFMGWSVAIAAALPLVAFGAAHIGWRETFGAIGIAAAIGAVLLALSIPPGLRNAPISLKSWTDIARRPLIVVLLLITALWTGGQFIVFPFLGPLIARLGGGGTEVIGICFALMGIGGFLGNVAATAVVNRLGPFRTSVVFLSFLLAGAAIWAAGAHASVLTLMAAGCGVWGLGFASFNSMQQARLVAAAPSLASASVALNTSSNYVGQAIGSAIGAELFVRGHYVAMGYTDLAFMLVAATALLLSRRLR